MYFHAFYLIYVTKKLYFDRRTALLFLQSKHAFFTDIKKKNVTQKQNSDLFIQIKKKFKKKNLILAFAESLIYNLQKVPKNSIFTDNTASCGYESHKFLQF